ncbi:hypothetical protein C8F04DRAFT_1094584 [Mycena alexandri]|uniref:Uncharacterized protein n=1 Tax=Mycena alexandri TaxID=1745969 RepID=A0AAD6T1Q9_9AGAR|nr:hypothetical protein C8F04DRAFT_1094584 [Mycena alexandri]
MRFSTSLLVPCFAALALAVPNVPRVISSNHGTIVEPTSGVVATTEGSLPFSYKDSNWCEAGYSPISVWLLDYAPTTANLNATGQFTDAAYYFGAFLIGNFGLPPLSGSPSPPTTLTLPDLSQYGAGSSMYIAVVETATTCPPGNQPAQYGLASVEITTA